MKFVTVMDMWLLLINIIMLAGVIYFGHKWSKTLTRLLHIGEQKDMSVERKRVIKIIEDEISYQQQIFSMNPDTEGQEIIRILNTLKQQMLSGK
jgi:hypothetical protein